MAVEVSNEFKNMCKSNTPSGAIGRITVLEEDPEDNVEITENTDIQSIEIEDNCYVNDKFIGTTVAKKVKVNLFNDNNVYDLENKEIEANLGFHFNTKNKLLNTGTTQTINGITFTVNADKTITANGTATANINYNILDTNENYSLPAGDYILSSEAGSWIYYYIAMQLGNTIYPVGSQPTNVTLTETTGVSAHIYVKNGKTLNNIVFKPMIRLASVEDNTYECYKPENEIISYGNYIIEKPNTEEVQAKTNFIGYDYMIKFNKEFVDDNTYPVSLGTFLSNLCTQVGVVLGSTTFVNSTYMVQGNPFTNGEKCKEVLSAVAQIAGGIAKIGRDNALYIINLSKTTNLEEIDGNNYDSFEPNNLFGPINKLIIKMNDGVDGEESVRSDSQSIAENGECAITISNNPILNSAEQRELIIDNIFNSIKGITYLPFKTSYYGYPYVDSTDKINVLNVNDTTYNSYIFNHSIKYDGAFSGNIETPALTKTQSMYQDTRDLKSWKRSTELAVDKINGQIKAIIDEQNDFDDEIEELRVDIQGVTNTISKNGGNNLFYYSKEFWEGQEVTITERRHIRVGDDLSGKKIYLSFPTTNPVSVLDYNTGNVIECQNGSIYHYKREAYYEEYVSVVHGIDEDMIYEMESSTYVDGVTEYTLPNDFGVVTGINDASGVYQYIEIDAERIERVLNIEEYTSTDFTINSTSGRGYIVNEGSSSQDTDNTGMAAPNGKYTISFKYKKIGPAIANTSVKINDREYLLTETNWTKFEEVIEVTSNHIKVEFISDTNNALYVADLLGNVGEQASIWTQNPNETRTDTVTIGKGIQVDSSEKNTFHRIDADGNRTFNKATGEVVSEQTDKGTLTKELIVREKAEISGLLIQEINGQIWLSSLL